MIYRSPPMGRFFLPSTSVVATVAACLAACACGDSSSTSPSDAGGTDSVPLDGDALTTDAGADAGTSDGAPADADAAADAAGDAVLTPTLSSIQAVVFTPTCAQGACHSKPGAPLSGDLDLSSASASYGNLVGVAAKYQGFTTELRVAPGDPTKSFLMVKLVDAWTGTVPAGTPMPYLPDPLPDAQIEAIRSWIAAGAPND